MNGQEIIDFATSLRDGDLGVDTDFALDLLNGLKDTRESEMELQILKKPNTSNQTSGSTTSQYLTAITLPTDFLAPLKRYAIVINQEEIFQVPIEEREFYRDDSTKFYIGYSDAGLASLYLCGVYGGGQTITINYIRKTDDLTLATSPIWPEKFHKILAYDLAQAIDRMIDADDLTFRMSAEKIRQGESLADAMMLWDHRLKIAAQSAQAASRITFPSIPTEPKRFQS